MTRRDPSRLRPRERAATPNLLQDVGCTPRPLHRMPCPDFALRLQQHAAMLLDRAQPDHALHAACLALYEDCLARSGPLDAAASALPDGHALSAEDAARCILDFKRTTLLLRAVDAAIARQLQRHATVRVLYAGCGPCAPLLLPLLGRYPAVQLQVQLLDVHAGSLAAAEQLCALAGVSDRLQPGLCADAATLELSDTQRPQVLVAELMQRALAKEPQVAVLLHLLPQCAADTVLVPECIEIRLALADLGREFDPAAPRRRVDLGALLQLDQASALRLKAAAATGVIDCPTLQVPADADPGLSLLLRTRVHAAAGAVLEDYDSGLSYPQVLHAVGPAPPGQPIHARYRLGPDPGFEVWLDHSQRHGAGVAST